MRLFLIGRKSGLFSDTPRVRRPALNSTAWS
ncbi:hypothetical protein [Pseudomonas neuropathica]|uniref:Uncharacterized protein n=1 Tax=Pseudomonas neuropathica TaxID=2730425 RepID=A0ACC7N4X3_9PSED